MQSAQEIAQKLNHQEVDCEHLLSALIEQADGLVRPLLDKLGANPDAILRSLDENLNRRPQVHGMIRPRFTSASHCARRSTRAFAQADKLKDQSSVPSSHVAGHRRDDESTQPARRHARDDPQGAA